jgi:hypothetical protein
MNNATSPTSQVTRSPFRSRLARFVQTLAMRRGQPDPRQIAYLATTVTNQPRLRRWVLTIASEAPRVRRALLARGAQELREIRHLGAADALEQMANAAVLHAVTETLLRRNALEPLQPQHRIGHSARTRFRELSNRLEPDYKTACAA